MLGKSHRADVLASRVPHDRRAIEASLVKALGASGLDDDSAPRLREFVAQEGMPEDARTAMLELYKSDKEPPQSKRG